MRITRTTGEEAACAVLLIDQPSTADALTAPTADDLLGPMLALLPQGAAWGTPDGEAISTDSMIARFWRAAMAPLATLFADADVVARESTASTLTNSLEDWERDYGLPDGCGDAGDEAARRRTLLSRVAGAAVMTPADYVCLAAAMGYTIEVVEYDGFRCAFDECGDELGCIDIEWQATLILRLDDLPGGAECGASECGGDDQIGEALQYVDEAECGDVECGDAFAELGRPWNLIDWAECGEAECGDAALGQVRWPAELECRIAHVQPAELRLVLATPIDAFS